VRAPGEAALMPDLRGRSAREAAVWAARSGLLVQLQGSGNVLEQSPAPGTPLEDGSSCLLTLGRRPRGTPPATAPAGRPEVSS